MLQALCSHGGMEAARVVSCTEMAVFAGMQPRHVAVLGVLITIVALAGVLRLLGSPAAMEEGSEARGEPNCEEGVVVVAWRGDGERVGCLEDLDELMSLAASGSRCRHDPRAASNAPVSAGDIAFVGRGEGRVCEVQVEPLSGARRLALGVPIDVNSATESDLLALRGIGPARARSIILERQENGPFTSVEDLRRVHGIGPVMVERLSPQVVAVGDDESAR